MVRSRAVTASAIDNHHPQAPTRHLNTDRTISTNQRFNYQPSATRGHLLEQLICSSQVGDLRGERDRPG
jgi:hypothetical protein